MTKRKTAADYLAKLEDLKLKRAIFRDPQYQRFRDMIVAMRTSIVDKEVPALDPSDPGAIGHIQGKLYILDWLRDTEARIDREIKQAETRLAERTRGPHNMGAAKGG